MNNDDYNYETDESQSQFHTPDQRALQVVHMAESIFEQPVTGFKKEWPTGKIPKPSAGDGHVGYPVWEFNIYQERIDSINQAQVLGRLELLKGGADSFFFEFIGEPQYSPSKKLITIKMRQQ